MLALEKVTREYVNGQKNRPFPALLDVSFQVPESQFVCLLGPSGCGKSTLLNLAAGFIRPTSGRISFNHQTISGPGPDRGVVFQEPALFPWLTAIQNIEFGLGNKGMPKRERRRKAMDYLHLVGLAGFDRARPHTLSGGQRQRVALARVLVLEPALLLMDEPFSALDANTRERLQDELLRIWEANRKTVLFVTHNVEEAAYLADRVIVLGPPPQGIRADMTAPLDRPRKRFSDQLRELTEILRTELDDMPCCMPPRQGDIRPWTGEK